MTNLSVGLIGAGAVGVFYSAHLAKQGANITIITRSPHEYTSPMHVTSSTGDLSFEPVHVCSFDGEAPNFDVLILATKALPDIDVVALTQPFMSPHTVLVVIQNGLFVENKLMYAYTQPILRGLAFICAARVARTKIHHMDYGSLVIGPTNCDLNDINELPVLAAFRQLSVPVQISNNINQSIWEKLIWNVPFNPLSVVCGGVTTDVLLRSSSMRVRIRGIMHEVKQAASLMGVDISDQFIDEKIRQTKAMVPYKTSMCLDFESGAQIEVDAILGNILRFSKEHHLDLPLTEALYQELQMTLSSSH